MSIRLSNTSYRMTIRNITFLIRWSYAPIFYHIFAEFHSAFHVSWCDYRSFTNCLIFEARIFVKILYECHRNFIFCSYFSDTRLMRAFFAIFNNLFPPIILDSPCLIFLRIFSWFLLSFLSFSSNLIWSLLKPQWFSYLNGECFAAF